MSITDFMNELAALTGPDREMDEKIARIGGWVRREDAARVYWDLDGTAVLKLPYFTGSMDAAIYFAKRVCPHVPVGGLSWTENKTGKALIGQDSETVEAATPAIALCIAAIQYRLRERHAAAKAVESAPT